MYVFTYIHACMHTYRQTYIYIYIYTYTYTYIYTYTHIHIHIHTHVHLHMHVHLHTHIHIHIHVHLHIHIHLHIHLHTHTHIYIYLYIFICIYIVLYLFGWQPVHKTSGSWFHQNAEKLIFKLFSDLCITQNWVIPLAIPEVHPVYEPYTRYTNYIIVWVRAQYGSA